MKIPLLVALTLLLIGNTATAQAQATVDLFGELIELGEPLEVHTVEAFAPSGELTWESGRFLFSPVGTEVGPSRGYGSTQWSGLTNQVLITAIPGNLGPLLPIGDSGVVAVRCVDWERDNLSRYLAHEQSDELVLFDLADAFANRVLFSPGGQLTLLGSMSGRLVVLVRELDATWLAAVDADSGGVIRADLPGLVQRYWHFGPPSGLVAPLDETRIVFRCAPDRLCVSEIFADSVYLDTFEIPAAELITHDESDEVFDEGLYIRFSDDMCIRAGDLSPEDWATANHDDCPGYGRSWGSRLIVSGNLVEPSVVTAVGALGLDWLENDAPGSTIAGILLLSNDTDGETRTVELLIAGGTFNALLSFTGFDPHITWGIALGPEQLEVRPVGGSAQLYHLHLQIPAEPQIMCGFPELRLVVVGDDGETAEIVVPLGGPCEGA